MSHSIEFGSSSLQELTEYEISFVSGGMEQQEQPNQDAGGVSGLVYAVLEGAVYSGLGAAIAAAAAGNPYWGAAGISGMVGGGVVGGLKHINK